MQFDWNNDEVIELKARAGVHGEDKTVTRHVERLDLHLKKYEGCRSRELRTKMWETIEDEAIKLDKLLHAMGQK